MSSRSLNILPPVLLVTAAILIATTSCGSEHREERAIGDSKHFPTMLTTDVSTFISDSGYTRYHVAAPMWIMYEEADTPFWTFPDGIDMQKFDDSMTVNATFRADSAVYFSVLKIWRFDGNVNMRNTDGDRFATPQLFWDQNSKRVYSDSFMHIERAERIIEGYGFESNDQMTEYTILHPQMILPIDRMRQERADRAAQDSLQALQADSVPNTETADGTEASTPDSQRPAPEGEKTLRRPDRERNLQSTAGNPIKKELK